MLQPVPAAAPRGACPGVHRPFAATDGLLMRVRVPGGAVSTRGLGALAGAVARHGAGPVELTNRANLQVRGVAGDALDGLRRDLVAAGLAPTDPDADERRNVLVTPGAGIDPSEVADVRPVARTVLAWLAGSDAPGRLHPKAGVLVDGGGAVSVRGRRHDVCLGATRRRDSGQLVIELAVGRALPLDRDGGGRALVVPVEDAAQVAVTLLAMAGEADPPPTPGTGPGDSGDPGDDSGGGAPARAADLVAASGDEVVIAEVARRTGVTVEAVDVDLLDRALPVPRAPLGLHPQRPAAHATATSATRATDGGVVSVGAAPVLGRLGPQAVAGVAAAVERHGGDVVRLTPWRSLLVPDVAAERATSLARELAALGLVVDPADPAASVVACVGSAGCSAGAADTLADAHEVVDRRRTAGSWPAGAASVHVSGCAKRCATRQPCDATLVAVGGGRYDVFVADPTVAGGERQVHTARPATAALALAAGRGDAGRGPR
jgi:precorrin-3B synthase